MTVLVLVMLRVCIGIPLGYAWRVFRLDEPSLSAWARPWAIRERSTVREHWATLVSLVLFGVALAYVGYGSLPPAAPRDLAFPIEGGRFMVAQGGGIGLLNHHAGHREQRHAADRDDVRRS